MSITFQQPRTIHLGGPITIVNNSQAGCVASAAITPGMVVERFNNSGTLQVRAHSTAGGFGQVAVALNQPELNHGVDTAYAVSDLVQIGVLGRGATAWALIPSGQNITQGAMMESNGDGKLRVFSAGTRLFQALESVNNSAGPSDARIRVEAL